MPIVVQGPLYIKDRAWDREVASVRSAIGRYASVHHLAVTIEDVQAETGAICISVEITFNPNLLAQRSSRDGLCVSQLPYFIEKLGALGYALRTATLTTEGANPQADVNGGVRFLFERRIPKAWVDHE